MYTFGRYGVFRTAPRTVNILRWILNSFKSESETFLDRLMASSFLLPIVGSPPTTGDMMMSMLVSSPMDDIAALSGCSAFSADHSHSSTYHAMEEKMKSKGGRYTLRRRLSTSFDEPGLATSVLLSMSSSNQNPTTTTAEEVRERMTSGSCGASLPVDRDGRWFEESCQQFSQFRINEGLEHSSFDRGGGGGIEKKVNGNIFQLLEKVIEFKSRNVSHVTVEQCVKDLCIAYHDTNESDRLKWFNLLGSTYGVDHSSIVGLANSLSTCQDEQMRLNLEEKLRTALIPKYQWLFSQVGRLENGVKFLVDLRTDVLDAIEKSTESTTLLKPLNSCLKELIGVWFAVGFLKLERITWNSPCEILQKISEYEAVHPMRNWTDLKKRVGPNRRCFVFTHASMPGEPVVVLHTALTNYIPSSIHKIVTKKRLASIVSVDKDSDIMTSEEIEDHDFIDTAIFYSITSTQKGLTGIELGNYLIKRVVRELQIEFPKMSQYSSLSPIPNFTKWLVGSLKMAQRGGNEEKIFSPKEMTQLSEIMSKKYPNQDFYAAMLEALKLNSWYSDGELFTLLEGPLMRLCAQYLYVVKRRGYALDPVAHFHLKNGAVLWRINWNGDVSPRGLTNSCGMMVNYRYFLEDCESNSQKYLEEQIVHISDSVRQVVEQTSTSKM